MVAFAVTFPFSPAVKLPRLIYAGIISAEEFDAVIWYDSSYGNLREVIRKTRY